MASRKEYHARYYQANKEKLKAVAKARYEADPEPTKARSAEVRATRPEEVAAYQAQYRDTHGDELRAKQREKYAADPEPRRAAAIAWRKAHPEFDRAKGHRRRALIRGSQVEKFTDLEVFEEDDYICQLCFEPIDPLLRNHHPEMASLDHIKPISKGGSHTRDNVQTSHLVCNLRKGNRASL
jgi:5-methylcytosine-specific restriction endonuclease McrA